MPVILPREAWNAWLDLCCPLRVVAARAAREAILHDGEQDVRIERLRDYVHIAKGSGDLQKIGITDAADAGDGDDLRIGPSLRIWVMVWMPSCSGTMMSVMTRSGCFCQPAVEIVRFRACR
jgi:hypothetical protein